MNVRVKGLLILGVLLVALYYVFPTYRAYFTNADPLSVEGKLNLGLDLQGGMYLDVEVKAGEAVREVTRRTAQELEDVMIDEQIDFIVDRWAVLGRHAEVVCRAERYSLNVAVAF